VHTSTRQLDNPANDQIRKPKEINALTLTNLLSILDSLLGLLLK
jgi:hypothetical protein